MTIIGTVEKNGQSIVKVLHIIFGI